MNVSNGAKKSVLVVCILVVILSLLIGIGKQKDWIYQTLTIILVIFFVIFFQGGGTNILKLKGKNVIFENDGIVGNLAGKVEAYGDGEIRLKVTIPPGYATEKYLLKEKSWAESFASMLTNTITISVIDKKSRFEFLEDSLAPEGCIKYHGHLSGIVRETREEMLEQSLEEKDHIIMQTRASLQTMKNGLEKQVQQDNGSSDGVRAHIQNIIDNLAPKVSVIDPVRRKEE